MSRPNVNALASEVVLLVKSALAPVTERLAVLEAKQAAPPMPDPEIAVLRERLAVLETRPQLPGPPGPSGQDGKDGTPGTAGLTYQGVFVEGKAYEKGDLTTWAGSTWHCNESTESKPGDGSHAWTLMVKRGRDGKDGKP